MKAKQVKLPKQKPITLEDITLDHWEEYDATQMQIMSFRHHYDIVNGAQFNVGNMCAVQQISPVCLQIWKAKKKNI